MMKILHVTCSPRGQAAESYRLSQRIVSSLLQKEPTAIVVNRAIGGGAISHVDEDYAISQESSADVSREGSMALSEELIRELESADMVVIGTPMHNFTVPSALKAWIDHVVRARRTFNVTTAGKVGTLRDRPVFVAISSGGRFSGERARQPDFLTPYLKAVLGIIGLHDLAFFSIEGTGSGPDAVAEARARTDRVLQEYFSSFRPRSLGGVCPQPAGPAPHRGRPGSAPPAATGSSGAASDPGAHP
jgi:FMN-dependent NADH-azoreductase